LSNIETNVFNMGCGQSITINYLAEAMQNIAGIHTKIEYLPERKADVKHCKADTSKINYILGFNTVERLEDGLKAYLDWYKNNIVKK